MAGTCVGPSKLHLKKELTGLGKVPFLREPRIFSSSRSHFNFRSTADAACSDHGSRTKGKFAAIYDATSSNKPYPRIGKKRKGIYLYNWNHHSSKSGDRGTNFDDDWQESKPESSEDISSNYMKGNINSAKCLDLVPGHGVRHRNQGMSDRIRLSRMCRSTIAKARSLQFCDSMEEKSFHSYTPSNSSYRLRGRYYDTISSLGATSASFDGFSFELRPPQQRRSQEYSCRSHSSRVKDGGGCRGCCSPSLSDTPRRGLGRILCQRRLSNKKHSSHKYRQNYLSQRNLSVPLLDDGGGSSADQASDELSSSMQELDLEAFSRLDGKKWSEFSNQEQLKLSRLGQRRWLNHRRQKHLELVLPRGAESEMLEKRSLCEKYRPRSFHEIIGQEYVVQSLKNAISKGRIAPAYVFHGLCGTGKTSVARVFAAALNCLSTEENRPCGFCKACTDKFGMGNGSSIREVNTNSKKGMNRLRHILKHMSMATTIEHREVIIVDGCHRLPSELWLEFCRIIEDHPPCVVFIFITTDPANLPHSIMSRSKKYFFDRIAEADIICRLRILCAEEEINIEEDALNLIASYSKGSLHEAEMMLDQLTLLGKKITATVIKDLVGVVSEEKLLDLLETAMSSNTAETVKMSRELMDSGIDPMALMSQLAGLLMDIIAGTYNFSSQRRSGSLNWKKNSTEAELERLQRALKILSDAERQLSLSSERSTWFTAALLQLSSRDNLEPTTPSSSNNKSNKNFKESEVGMAKQTSLGNNSSHPLITSSSITRAKFKRYIPHDTSCSSSMRDRPTDVLVSNVDSRRILQEDSHSDEHTGKMVFRSVSPGKLDTVWRRCIKRCHLKLLRHLLSTYVKLISIKEYEGTLIAYLAVTENKAKQQAERFLSSITNLVGAILKHDVKVIIDLVPEIYLKAQISIPHATTNHHKEIINFVDKAERSNLNMNGSSDDNHGVNCSNAMLQRSLDKFNHSQVEQGGSWKTSSIFHNSEGNNKACDKCQVGSAKRQSPDFYEQRLEIAWLEEAKKSEIGFTNHSIYGTNSNLQYSGMRNPGQNGLTRILSTTSKQDTLDDEIEELNTNSSQNVYTREIGNSFDRYYAAVSPSLLHIDNFKPDLDNKSLYHESYADYSGFCCWKTRKSTNRKTLVRQGSGLRPKKGGRSLIRFSLCWKMKSKDSHFRR